MNQIKWYNITVEETIRLIKRYQGLKDNDENTPLHLVCRYGEFKNIKEAILYLIKHNPKGLVITNKIGETPLDIISSNIRYTKHKEKHNEIILDLIKNN